MEVTDINNIDETTSLQGVINITYADLVKVFGPPDFFFDDHKINAEWSGRICGNVFTIYNWKDGKNYCGIRGLAIKDITKWNIGGHSQDIVILLGAYLKECSIPVRYSSC